MKMRIAAATVADDIVDFDTNMLAFAGKQAGICYMPDTYDALEADKEGALKRIKGCMRSGHHSVIEHCYVTVIFENVSKLFAMLLNSLQAYNTSEKSGRYTVMQSENDGLYGKWLSIFKPLYLKDLEERGVTGSVLEKMSKKMAQDSARGVISVLSPNTTFAYTTSLRMWNYIRCWAMDYLNTTVNDSALLPARDVLKAELGRLIAYIDSTMWVENLDNHSNGFEFITNFTDTPKRFDELGAEYRNWGVQYLISYKASFIVAAQLERHRTIKYYMSIPKKDIGYSVPNIIKGTKYEPIWMDDLATVELPQAMQVTLIEMGNVDTFVMKCRERVCGAAHEETRELTVKLLKEYYNYSCECGVEQRIVKDKLASCMLMDNVAGVLRPRVKCKKGYKCTSPCIYKKDVENL